MAGEWIKVETCLSGKAEVIRLARLMSVKRDEALGMVVRFWVWADSNTVDGVVDGVASQDVDAVLSTPGLCRALELVGWLQIDSEKERITIPKFSRHNGESAKKRALKNERQAKWRANLVDAHVDADASLEKRREEKKQHIATLPPSGAFLKFWSSWPKGQRKQAQGKCWTLWRRSDFDQHAPAIISHVETLKSSEDWRRDSGRFVPAPLVYLNQRRWEGAEQADPQERTVAL